VPITLAETEKRVQALEKFLGVDRYEFFNGSSYFNTWMRAPKLVDLKPLDLGPILKKHDIMRADDFWIVIDQLNWKRIRGKRGPIKKATAWLDKNFDTTQAVGLQNRYDFYRNWLGACLDAYIVATSDTDGTSDDGRMDLLDECIGRGRKFYESCILQPSILVEVARKGDYYENFHYIFHVLLHNRPDAPAESSLISWRDVYGIKLSDKELSWGVSADRTLVRHFQCAYGTIPGS
jgi:hypothetical protein